MFRVGPNGYPRGTIELARTAGNSELELRIDERGPGAISPILYLDDSDDWRHRTPVEVKVNGEWVPFTVEAWNQAVMEQHDR